MNKLSRLFSSLFLLFTVAALAQSDFSQFVANRTIQVEAEQLEIDGKYIKAAKRYMKLSRQTKDQKTQAGWMLRAADCLYTANKSHRALEIYKKLLATVPFFVPYEHVVGKLRDIAERFIDGHGTFLGLRDPQTAIGIYELIIREVPSIHVSLQDRMRLAELQRKQGRAEEAANTYQTILKLNPNLDDVRLDLAMLLAKLSKSGDGDGAKLRAALRHATAVKENQPNHPRIEEIEQLLLEAKEQEAQQMLDLSKFYLRPSHLRASAARRYLIDLIKDFPETKAAKEAEKLLQQNKALQKINQTEEK